MTDTSAMTFGLVSKPKKRYTVVKWPDKMYTIEAKDLKEIRKKIIASYKRKGCNKHIVVFINDADTNKGYGSIEFTQNGPIWVEPIKLGSRPLNPDGSIGKW